MTVKVHDESRNDLLTSKPNPPTSSRGLRATAASQQASSHGGVLIFTYNQIMQATQRLPYLWDYNLDQRQFQEILNGRLTKGRLNQDWATRRLLEYAPYDEIIRLLGYKRLVENWSRWRGRIRSKSRVRGFDFLVQWLPEKHPELLRG